MIRRVQGHSMLPYLKSGQLVIAKRRTRIRPGQLVIVSYRGQEIIKLASKVGAQRIWLSGGDRQHDIGWISRRELIGIVLWPRIAVKPSGDST